MNKETSLLRKTTCIMCTGGGKLIEKETGKEVICFNCHGKGEEAVCYFLENLPKVGVLNEGKEYSIPQSTYNIIYR